MNASSAARVEDERSAGDDSSATVRSWNDAPLRMKVTLLVLLAAVGGAMAGLLEARTGHLVWPLGLGLAIVTGLVLRLAHGWVWHPFERLVTHASRVSARHRPVRLHALPTHRHDEVGQIARAMHELWVWSRRDHSHAHHLRRTLNDRVTKATRRATRQLAQLSMRDPLTNLGNRRFLDANLQPLTALCQTTGEDLICIAVDLDNFKTVNDALGHARGDQLLRFLGQLLRDNIRRQDCPVRLGGDEFVLLLPGCPTERGEELSRQLVTLFAQHVSATMRTGPLTRPLPGLSIGIASLKRDHPTDGQALLAAADARLYEAKRQGKGRCVGA